MEGSAARASFAQRTVSSRNFKIASTAGTHADAEHIQTADDAVDEAERIFNQKHHASASFHGVEVHMTKMEKCLNSSRFESILSAVICLNMILIIAETDLTADGQDAPVWITTANITFLAVYLVESAVKILVFRCSYFQDTWNLLDLFVVLSDVCLTALNFLDGVERISVMRVFRLIKLSRAIRVIRQIWELKILLLGFKAAAKSIFFGMGMVLVMTMVWAILGVQLIHPVNADIWANTDCERCQRAFSSVWNACITIFQTVIAGDSWGLLAIPLIESQWWTSVWFLIVLVTVQLAMLNLILAVIVERAADARDKEEQRAIMEQEETMHKSKLKLIQLCRDLDTDGNGRLSEDEFLDGFENNPKFAAALLGMGVYPEDIGLLFDVLDTHGSGEVTYVSFVNTLARLRTQMNQVILFSITELRKAVSEIKDELRNGKRHQQFDGLCSAAMVDGDSFKTNTGGIDKILAQQMEEMNQKMQLRFQQMQLEISSSFQNALRISIEAHRIENGQLDSMSKDLELLSKNTEAGAEPASVWRRMFPGASNQHDPAISFSGPPVPSLPTVQAGGTPLMGGLCCQPAGLSARETIRASNAREPTPWQSPKGRPV